MIYHIGCSFISHLKLPIHIKYQQFYDIQYYLKIRTSTNEML